MGLFDKFKKEPPAEESIAEYIEEDGFEKPVLPIGEEQIRRANDILRKYMSDKKRIDDKVIANEDWWKMRHWEQFRTGDKAEVAPSSAHLWNCVVSKHADAMDAYPEPNIRPRMADDVEEAKLLSKVMPVVLEQNDFQQKYSQAWYDKLKFGSGIYGVFWDGSLHNGIGDISIEVIDILRLYWESGVTDIQDSPNVFLVTLVNNDSLEAKYPQLKGKLSQKGNTPPEYRYDNNVDNSDKSSVIDWYYKKHVDGRTVLHYCKFVNSFVLFATENEPETYPNGWYDHGEYPFEIDNLYPIKGTPIGYGCIDIGKAAQEQIDVLNQAIVKNATINAKPRYFVRSDSGINEKEFADTNNDFVHFTGMVDENSIVPIAYNTLSDIYVSVMNNKIEELKETVGNRDVANGGTTSGVTAASGVAAMMEASGKLSRAANKASYDSFRRVVLMVIELMRQFYTAPRYFRITGEMGREEFVAFDNSGLQNQPVGDPFAPEMYRTPIFDAEVNAQKSTPYSKMAQNELALQLNGAGVFMPNNARPALAMLDMMDFAHKEDVMQKVAENDVVMQTAQLALQMAMRYEPMLVPQIAQALGVQIPTMPTGGANLREINADGTVDGGEAKHMQKARAQAQEASQVR